MELKEKIQKRQQSNLEIIALLKDIAEKNPDLRFGQILYNYGILKPVGNSMVRDPFYDESVDTLAKLKNALNNN